ncbi:MAG TPA: AI-2E family transporter, partial [Candidatus Limnocylindrales bacterium]|nr:AI-2E family transporter [Candidatus Limnocylindrales bacterium]
MTVTARRLQAPTPRVALLAAAVVVLAVLLYLARHVLAPFVIGMVLVYALDPLVDRLARLRLPGLGRPLPRGLAVLVVYLVVAVVLVEGLALLFRPLAQQLGEYLADLPGFAAVIDEQLRRLAEAYQGLALPETIRGAVDRFVAGLREGAGGLDPATLLPLARTIAGAVGAVLGLLIVPVWAFYILKDRDELVVGFDRALPPSWRADVWAVLNIVERTFGRWLRGQLLLGLVVGMATFGGLLLLGVLVDARFIRFAVLLAVVAGIFE